jgi:hypothetical protein
MLRSQGAAQTYHNQYNLQFQCHHHHDLAPLSPAWLGIYIASWKGRLGSVITSITRQYCHQHDLASTSRHGQVTLVASSPAWLYSIVTSMTHIYITPRLGHLGSIIPSMTRHLHHATAKLHRQHVHQHDSAALSPVWLNIYIAPWPKSPRQHRHQQDSVALSLVGLDSIVINMSR